jgi:hypothetical protein
MNPKFETNGETWWIYALIVFGFEVFKFFLKEQSSKLFDLTCFTVRFDHGFFDDAKVSRICVFTWFRTKIWARRWWNLLRILPEISGKCFNVVRLLPLRFTSNSIPLLLFFGLLPVITLGFELQGEGNDSMMKIFVEDALRIEIGHNPLENWNCFVAFCGIYVLDDEFLCLNWYWIVFLMVNLERIGVELCLLRWFQWLKEFVRALLGWRVGRVKMSWWFCFDELAMSLWLCDDDVLYL